MSAHPPVKPELTHPVLWTVALVVFIAVVGYLFTVAIGDGLVKGSTHLPKASAPKAVAAQPDHKGIVSSWNDDSLAQGEAVYMQNCASCHGAKGEGAVAGARKFISEAFQNETHGPASHPMSIYDTLTNGWNGGAMAPQRHLSPEDRYAVTQYIREAFVKPSNPSQYVELTDDIINALPGPVAGSGDAGPKGPHPATVPVAIPVYGVMSDTAAAQASDEKQMKADAWIKQSAASSDTVIASYTVSLAQFADQKIIADLYNAVSKNSRESAKNLLTSSELAALDSQFATLREDEFGALYSALYATHKELSK